MSNSHDPQPFIPPVGVPFTDGGMTYIIPTASQVAVVLSAAKEWREEIRMQGRGFGQLHRLLLSKIKLDKALWECGYQVTHEEPIPDGAEIITHEEDDDVTLIVDAKRILPSKRRRTQSKRSSILPHAQFQDRNGHTVVAPLNEKQTHMLVSHVPLASCYEPDPDGRIGEALHRLWELCENGAAETDLNDVIDVLESRLSVQSTDEHSSKRFADRDREIVRLHDQEKVSWKSIPGELKAINASWIIKWPAARQAYHRYKRDN